MVGCCSHHRAAKEWDVGRNNRSQKNVSPKQDNGYNMIEKGRCLFPFSICKVMVSTKKLDYLFIISAINENFLSFIYCAGLIQRQILRHHFKCTKIFTKTQAESFSQFAIFVMQ